MGKVVAPDDTVGKRLSVNSNDGQLDGKNTGEVKDIRRFIPLFKFVFV